MDCPDLIAEYLQNQKTAHEGKRKGGDADGDESKSKKKKDDVSKTSLPICYIEVVMS